MTRSAFDVSDPAGPALGFDICAFYAWGNTPHVWTLAQLDAQPARYRLPICVPFPDRTGQEQARQFDLALTEFGCPHGVAVALDMEANRDPSLVNGFADQVHADDRFTIVYGSTGSLFYNPVRSGYWVADPTGSPHMYEHPHTVGTQYSWQGSGFEGQRIDLSLFTDGLALWDTKPGGGSSSPTGKVEVITDLQTIRRLADAAITTTLDYWK